MVRAAIWTYILIGFCLPAHLPAQDPDLAGPEGIVPGPYGLPRMVLNEGNGWDIPIKVFENEKYEVFIPDLTNPGWVQAHVGEFRSQGTYVTNLYIYKKDTRSTERELIYVSTVGQGARVVGWSGAFKVNLAKGPVQFTKSIERTNQIVEQECARFKGLTQHDAIKQQAKVVSRMAAGIENSAEPENGSISSIDAQRAPITPPVVLSSPAAQYTAEARLLKINGSVVVTATVDKEGHPQDVRVSQPLGHGLDEQAVVATKRYLFSPAIDKRTGSPIEFKVTIEAKFKLY